MWSEKKPWWQRKAGENEGKHAKDLPYARNWCVIKVHVGHRYSLNQFDYKAVYQHKAVGRSNAPQYWNEERQKYESSAVMDYLTKAEAIACAKGLNFFEN